MTIQYKLNGKWRRGDYVPVERRKNDRRKVERRKGERRCKK